MFMFQWSRFPTLEDLCAVHLYTCVLALALTGLNFTILFEGQY